MSRQKTPQSTMKPKLADADYTIFDALLESMKKKELEKSARPSLLKQLFVPLNLASLSLMVIGSATSVWITNLILFDITFWQKDIGLILFGSRIGEAISLGMGIQVIHYVLIGAVLMFSGLLMLFRNRIISKKQPVT